MATNTPIEWTDMSWNPVSGCSKVSQGCKNCYAERVFPRPYPGRKFTDVRTHPDRLEQPLHWRKPRRVFVNSMSDLFHEDVPDEFIDAVMRMTMRTPRHRFQILTKRPERMLDYMQFAEERARYFLAPADTPCWVPWPPPNVWLGVSVEDQATADERIPLLLQTPAAVRFVSAEPLLGPIEFTEIRNTAGLAEGREFINALGGFAWSSGEDILAVPGLDWIIVGGESGPGARPCDVEWIRSIVGECGGAGVWVFVKQLGARPTYLDADRSIEAEGWPDHVKWGRNACLQFRDRKGGDPAEWPEDLRVREFPA